MSNSISLLRKESNDYHKLLKSFRSIVKDPYYNPFEFNYTQQEQSTFKKLQIIYLKVLDVLEKNKLPESRLLCLRADGKQDGHALSLEGEVVTFIDFKAYSQHLSKVGFDSFSHLLHEMLHASHYSLNGLLCPLSSRNEEDPILVKSLVEGVAVLCAQEVFPDGDNYWFGYMNNRLRQKWVYNSEKCYEDDLLALHTGKYSKDQEINLLGLEGFSDDKLVRGRRSYYIVSEFLKKQKLPLKKILALSLSDFRNLLV